MALELNFEDRKKGYLEILKEGGQSAALTAIHHDLWELEFECFEGERGYRPELYTEVQRLRDFSREIWEMNQY